jgi:hypothetical protein
MIVSTLSIEMTQTALAAPSKTPTPTNTITVPTFASPTLTTLTTPLGTSVASIPVTACYAMSYVSDVTIPDNTTMTPGQTFTKTWRVRNSGTCSWDAGFKFAFTTGDGMSGTTYTLTQAVPVNTETNLSINMTAPSKSGSIKSSWRMSTAGGQFFGDEIYVLIVVGGAASGGTATNTGAPAASTATSTVAAPSATMTPTTPIP